MYKILYELKVDYHYLDGSTPQAQRKDIVEAFQSGDKSVFLLSSSRWGWFKSYPG